jgi:UDPglucose--hexose-1-phosphate uridylyltransferase
MPVRTDELTGFRVLTPEGARNGRPNCCPEFDRIPTPMAACPFCLGNERFLKRPPREIHGLRVIDNKYPLVSDINERQSQHVVILANGHTATPMNIGPEGWDRLWITAGEEGRRLYALGQQYVRHVRWWMNYGRLAGETIDHLHLHVAGFTTDPTFQQQLQRQIRHYHKHGEPMERAIFQKATAGDLIIAQTRHLWAHAPWASPHAWQVRIMPTVSSAAITEDQQHELGPLVYQLLTRLASAHCAKLPALNIGLHQTFRTDDRARQFCWHLDIIPRISVPGGVEIAHGLPVNPVDPAGVARDLRAIIP